MARHRRTPEVVLYDTLLITSYPLRAPSKAHESALDAIVSLESPRTSVLIIPGRSVSARTDASTNGNRYRRTCHPPAPPRLVFRRRYVGLIVARMKNITNNLERHWRPRGEPRRARRSPFANAER